VSAADYVAMAHDALHRSCATTPSALRIDADIARRIALDYLALALVPSTGEPWAAGWPDGGVL
jgi:hypothetical protein